MSKSLDTIKIVNNMIIQKCDYEADSDCVYDKNESKKPELDQSLTDSKKLQNFKMQHQNLDSGGRLKFYKDGKFIFELKAEKGCNTYTWTSVPKIVFESKNFPLKFSDCRCVKGEKILKENSSSTRKHRFKQNSPKRKLNQNTLIYRKSKCNFDKFNYTFRYGRKPFQNEIDKIIDFSTHKKKFSAKNTSKCLLEKKNVASVLDSLLEKQRLSMNLEDVSQNFISIPSVLKVKGVHKKQITSPRKRILKELEKVTIDDLRKKCKNKESKDSFSQIGTNIFQNYVSNQQKQNKSLNSSYSINSLLGDSVRKIKKSEVDTEVNLIPKNLSHSQINGVNNEMDFLLTVKSSTETHKNSDLDISNINLTKDCSGKNKTAPKNYSSFETNSFVSTNLNDATRAKFQNEDNLEDHKYDQNEHSNDFQNEDSTNVEKGNLLALVKNDKKNKKKHFSDTKLCNGEEDEKRNEAENKTNCQDILGRNENSSSMIQNYSQNSLDCIWPSLPLHNISYYYPYSTAQAFWMHYQSSIISGATRKISPSLQILNRTASSSSLNLIPEYLPNHDKPDIAQLFRTDSPISLCVKDKKDDSVDVPLNLSKQRENN